MVTFPEGTKKCIKRNSSMKARTPLTFKIASEKSEFEQIYRLAYSTFVEEMPRYEVNPDRILVDRFDQENTYIVCKRDAQLLGMVAIRGQRPFSLDEKVEQLDSYLPAGRSACEIRLLSVERRHRKSPVFLGLVKLSAQYCRHKGFDLAVISGTVKQQKLYKHLGFVPFGPLVGTPNALFQPMYLTLETFEEPARAFFRPRPVSARLKTRLNLLPGPVGMKPEVRRAFGAIPVSHRAEAFVKDFQHTKRLLCDLLGARQVEIFLGSGTLANDVIAGQLSLKLCRGLILTNGEFGNRLLDHASRFGLSFEVLHEAWGEVFQPEDIRRILDRHPGIEWLWAVHCETSTGILNDVIVLQEICSDRNIRLCLDCISSIGTVPVDLRNVYLASGVSGKGLSALPGLAMVFYNHAVQRAPKLLPRYLDLGLYAAHAGIPFTQSSNLLYALLAALDRRPSKARLKEFVALSSWLRSRLRELGFRIVEPPTHASPAVITLALPDRVSSEAVGRQLEEAGFLLSYRSEYLLKRNWIQICLMGECSQEVIVPLLELLKDFSTP